MNEAASPALPAVEYRRMALLLRLGLLTSLVILSGATLAYVLAHPGLSLSAAIASNPIAQFLGLPGLAAGLAAGDPAAYMTLGLVVLVATPILRVLTGFYYFRLNHERGMEAITLAVLAMLLFGVLVLGPLIR